MFGYRKQNKETHTGLEQREVNKWYVFCFVFTGYSLIQIAIIIIYLFKSGHVNSVKLCHVCSLALEGDTDPSANKICHLIWTQCLQETSDGHQVTRIYTYDKKTLNCIILYSESK